MGLASNPPFENLTPQSVYYSQETSASVDLPKMALGLQPDTMLTTLPFTELGKKDIWKPSTEPGKPTLPPLGRSRTSSSDINQSNESTGLARDILKGLPEDIQAGLSDFNKLPAESRNEAASPGFSQWKALSQVILLAAQTESFISFSVDLSKRENEQYQAMLSSQLPSIVSGSMVADSEKQAEMLKEELKRRDNDPTHDSIHEVLADLEKIMMNLSRELKRQKELS